LTLEQKKNMFFVDFLALKENVAFIRENIQKC
jgi:hypothetical protein